jgi:hypothetical protein
VRIRLLNSVGASVVLAAVLVGAMVASTASAEAPAAAAVLKTPWGEPDLQGIWTDESDTPLQRSPRYANQEFFTAAQREEIDLERSELLGRDSRAERGTERDVGGSYNSVFLSVKRVGVRTSKIVDPPYGRLPSVTPDAQRAAAADREFYLALLQSTETCKTKSVGCAGGRYDPTPSRRHAELPPRYNTQRINRDEGPEDHWPNDRCLTAGLPEFGTAFGGSFRRIVQTPGGVSMFYDVGQGQGWQRNIVMTGSPHLPADIRQWYGDSRGHWEGNTLVVDITSVRKPISAGRARTCTSSSAGRGPGRPRSDTRPRSKIRPCGRGHGLSSRSSRGRAIRRTESITNLAASKETWASRGCCMDGASKSAPLRRDEVLIRQPGTT